jgi:lactoylglutathione lyase
VITGLAHVAVRVTDLDAAVKFYCDGLGLRYVFDLKNEAGEVWLAYLAAGKSGFVELFPNAKPKPGEEEWTTGYHHVCLEVDDMARTLEELRRRGLSIEGDATRGEDGNVQYWLNDPDGNPIELMQMFPDSLQAKGMAKLRAGGLDE